MENYLKVGCNFTNDFIDSIVRINNLYSESFVSEVYGSRSASSLLSARPKFRIPDLTKREFEYYVKNLDFYGIKFNYTLNASNIGSKRYLLDHKKDIKDYISFLINAGVDTITVSLPLMAEYIRAINDNIKIEVSTIAHIETVVLLSQQKPSDRIAVELDLDELDVTSAETKATYNEIKDYVLKEHGLKVSNLYISQVKRKCGLEVGENYNLAKSEDAKQPNCPEEKEKAIMDALKHFGMIS